LFFAHIFVKNGSIYVEPRPKWSPAHSTHIVVYILSAKILRFCDICLSVTCLTTFWPHSIVTW